jgi:hydroxymethylpyrimidine pyrophosphatase-like HAD family hydrolase
VIRLVATDLDGTLWDRTIELRADVRRAVEELQRRGVIVVAATGRRPRSARTALHDNGLPVPAVCLDGTFGEDFLRGTRFHEALFEPVVAASVLAAFAAHGVAPNVFVDHPEIDVLLAEEPRHRPERAESLLAWARIGPLAEVLGEHRVAAFTVIGGAFEELAPLAAAVVSGGSARATLTADSLYGGTSLSIIPAVASKWAGVAAFAALAGIEADEIVGVGDAANDLELLQGAGYAVAVRTATSEVLAAADEIIDAPGDGGWAALVEICAALD